jgi:hypothetical protein
MISKNQQILIFDRGNTKHEGEVIQSEDGRMCHSSCLKERERERLWSKK